MSTASSFPDRTPTGVPGLDRIIDGGLPTGFPYLLEGKPGAGKTTAGLQFAYEGTRLGETVLYVTLSQTEREILASTDGRGWSRPPFEIYELAAQAQLSSAEAHQTLFHPNEVELEELTGLIIRRAEETNAARVVIDSMVEIRMLAGDALHYRRQVLALQHHLQAHRATVLMLDDPDEEGGYSIDNLVHGTFRLHQLPPEYGRDRRQIRVQKLRSSAMSEGFHDVRILREGVRVYPRLVAADHRTGKPSGHLSSGVKELNSLLGGGLTAGTSNLFLGPAGIGKSSLATQFICHHVSRGGRAAMWIFDESRHTFFSRSHALGMPIERAVQDGQVMFRQIDPAEMTPGEFLGGLRAAVEDHGADLVVVDSLNGFMAAMPGERNLTLHLHELVAYLNEKGVASILVYGQPGLFAPFSSSPPYDITYLADAILLARYYEYRGEVRKALSVFKKRADPHETTIRDLELRANGISVGAPLREFRGVLSGLPELEDGRDEPGGGHRSSPADHGGDPHGGEP